jgi:hypothetical protein
MKDLRGKLDKLRANAQDCALMSMLATNPKNRELFKRLADQLAIEALELEQVMKCQNEHLNPNDQHDVLNFNVLLRARAGLRRERQTGAAQRVQLAASRAARSRAPKQGLDRRIAIAYLVDRPIAEIVARR